MHLLPTSPCNESFVSCRLFTYAIDEEAGRGFKCGSVIINDRFAILAAHCLASFGE